MDLPNGLLSSAWTLTAWALLLPVFAYAVRRAPWRRLVDSSQLNAWLGMIVVLMLFWSLKAGVKPGLSLHLLGATVFTLAFGPWLAFLGLCAVLAAVTLNGGAGWQSFAANALLMAGVAVTVSHLALRASERYLPRHLFVYLFVCGFFASGLAVSCVGLTAGLLLALAGVYEVQYLAGEYLPYFLLLGFAEAWLSGMVLTLFVIYRPDWVSTFDDKRYLRDK